MIKNDNNQIKIGVLIMTVLPTFLIAGAAKSGSSTLYHHLGLHPDILMSVRKEPNYFGAHWGEDISFYDMCFPDYSGQKEIGEATVEYMRDPEVPIRIYQTIPNIKLIFTLRDPISRATSHYWWRVHTGIEKRTLDEVLRNGVKEYPIDYGLYYTHIKRFLNYFPRKNMHFVIMENMKQSLKSTLISIYNFLEVNQEITPLDLSPKNIAYGYRSFKLQKIMIDFYDNYKKSKFYKSHLLKFGRHLYNNIIKANKVKFIAPPISIEQYDLLHNYFYDEIINLEKLLEIKLENWYEIKN